MNETQLQALEWLTKTPKAMLADAPGVGKTWPLLEDAHLSKDPTLFVVPAHLQHQWMSVAADLYPDEPPMEQLKKRQSDLPRWGITSYHKLRRPSWHPVLLNYHWRRVVYDEVHHLRNRKAGWTKAAFQHPARVVRLATGTPEVTNGGDWYVYTRLMGLLPHRSYWRFVHDHCNEKWTPWAKEVLGLKDPEAFHRDVLGDAFMRRELDFLDEPVYMETRLKADRETAREHARVKKEARGSDGEPLENAAHHLRELVSTSRNKVAWLETVLERHPNERVVVLTWYRSVREHVHERVDYERRSWAVRAEEPKARQAEKIRLWSESPRGVLVGSLYHLKEGVDGLQSSSRVLVLYERSHLHAENEQAVARLWRRGQEQTVLVYLPVVERTIDAAVARAAERRRRMSLADLLLEDE